MKFFRTLCFLVCALAVVGASETFAAGKDAAKDKSANEATTSTGSADAWSIRCNKDDKAKDTDPKRGRCEIYQRLVVKETNKRLIEAAIGFPKDKTSARGIFIVPLGVLLPAGLQMKVDDGQAFKFEARYCDEGGCYGYVDLTDQILDTMRKGKKLTLTFQSANQKTINVEMSLKNFADALAKVS